MKASVGYPWPANIGELDNSIKSHRTRGGVRTSAAPWRLDNTGPAVGISDTGPAILADSEREHILGLLRETG